MRDKKTSLYRYASCIYIIAMFYIPSYNMVPTYKQKRYLLLAPPLTRLTQLLYKKLFLPNCITQPPIFHRSLSFILHLIEQPTGIYLPFTLFLHDGSPTFLFFNMFTVFQLSFH